jgi:hypothetical protein
MGSPGGRWDVKLSPQIEWRVLCLLAAGPERMSLECCEAPRRHDLVAAQHRDRVHVRRPAPLDVRREDGNPGDRGRGGSLTGSALP